MNHTNTRKAAVQATLHCLTGCAIGEVLGMIIGTAMGLSDAATIIIAVSLAFAFGYALSMIPLLKAGLNVGTALTTAFAADSISIAVMEIVDNAVMWAIPGAMGEGLDNPLFWLSLAVALMIAFVAALPVNAFLLRRGLGHALAHKHHHSHHE